MIAIVNVDPNPRIAGEHLYELRINKELITTFAHNREEGLAVLLLKASEAADMEKMSQIAAILSEVTK